MKTIAFIVCGYGVPKNMTEDTNHQIYLRTAANRIYDALSKEPSTRAIVVATGGPTDMHKPYKRTEAGVIADYMKELLNRPVLKLGKRVKILKEPKALSSLENMLNSKRLLSRYKLASVTIFCEWTRKKKLKTFGSKVFKRKITVDAIDFDQSANRYLDPEFLRKKEALDMKIALQALKDPVKFRKLHKLFERKFTDLRAAGEKNQVQAIQDWWKKEMNTFLKKS